MIAIENILDILKKDKRIFAWNLREEKKDSYELYFILQNLDMNREVVVTDYFVTIFVKEKERMGSSSFILYPSMTLEEIKDKIDEQLIIAKYTLDKPYELPRKVILKPIIKDYGFSYRSLKEIAFIAADAVFDADKYESGLINSAEIFINKKEVKFYDSKDNYFVFTTQNGQVELVCTWWESNGNKGRTSWSAEREKKANGKEIELYKFFEFDKLGNDETDDNDYIKNQTNELFLEASDRIKAMPTPELNNYKVLLRKDYVKTFFNTIAALANNDNVYNHQSFLKAGKDLHNGSNKCDRITLRAEGTLNNSTIGMTFDEEGTALKKLVLFDKGIAKHFWGSNAKSQYLRKTPNGIYKNFVAHGGTLEDSELEDENYVEIVSLSDFDIDVLTGDFGSEIRLAYVHTKNKEVQIVTGGSVSGNIYDNMETVRFTKETEQNNNFIGPKGVLLEKVSFNKGD